MVDITIRKTIENILGLNDKCEFWYIDGIKCEGYKEDSVTCNEDDGIGCGIRKKLLSENK